VQSSLEFQKAWGRLSLRHCNQLSDSEERKAKDLFKFTSDVGEQRMHKKTTELVESLHQFITIWKLIGKPPHSTPIRTNFG
jgi:hypothetical protein